MPIKHLSLHIEVNLSPKMRGYPQFSFWISIALFNGMIYIVIFWKKKILPALVSTVLKGRLIDSIAHYPAEL